MAKKNKPNAAALLDIESYATSVVEKAAKSPEKAASDLKSTVEPPIIEEKIDDIKEEIKKSIEPKQERAKKKAVGRPKSNHGKVPFTVLLHPKNIKKLKVKAINSDMQINELLDEILSDYL